MNIGIYCRKSYYSDTSESTKMQVEACKEYAERFGVPDSITVYEDDGYIRSDIDRPGINKLRRDIADGLIDCVMVYRIDRITSRMVDFCNFYANLKDKGIKFITVKDGIDTTTPIGEAMMYLAVIFSGIEIEQDTLRITDNLNHLAASGYWCGGQPPLGYRIETVRVSDKKSHKILVADPEAIEWKKWLIGVMLDNKFSLQRLETWCRNNGVKTKAGKLFTTTQLHQIITSPMCVENTQAMYDHFAALGCQMDEGSPRDMWDGKSGIMVYGRTTERRDASGKKRHVKASPDRWRISIGHWEPYLPADTYLQVMGLFNRHQFDRTMKHDTTLLKGVLRCKCGRLMGLARKPHVDGTVMSWYKCPKRERHGVAVCDCSAIKTGILDDKVREIFRQIEIDPKVLERYIPKQKKSPADEILCARKTLEQVEAKIDRLTAQLAENGTSTAAKYIVKEIEKLDLEATDLRQLISEQSVEARRAEKDLKTSREKRAEIVRLCRNIDELTIQEQNEIARSVIKEAVWDGDTLKITL